MDKYTVTMHFTEEKGHSNQYYADPEQKRPVLKELYLMKGATGGKAPKRIRVTIVIEALED